MAARVDTSKAFAKIIALGNILKRPLRDVLDSGAKTVAINCARVSQPFGTGADAKNAGDTAVTRDIHRIYGNAGGAYEAITNARIKGAFWFHYKAGHYSKAKEIAATAGVEVGEFDGGSLHRAQRRDKRPLVSQKKPRYFIISASGQKRLASYIKEEQKHVGAGKGGWADVARALGSTPRGLRTENDITANWITRNGHGYGSAVHGGSDESPTIRITNRIPYADQILDGTAKTKAEQVGRHRMLENLRFAIDAEARKLKRAA